MTSFVYRYPLLFLFLLVLLLVGIAYVHDFNSETCKSMHCRVGDSVRIHNACYCLEKAQ